LVVHDPNSQCKGSTDWKTMQLALIYGSGATKIVVCPDTVSNRGAFVEPYQLSPGICTVKSAY
jgi:hypothetical protein